MEWTIAVILGVSAIAVLFALMARMFSKEMMGIKMLFIMFCLGSLVLLSDIIHIIITSSVYGTVGINLAKMSETLLIISIVLFCFFIMYFLITYTVKYFKSVRDSNKSKKEESQEEWERN